jgi:hypothetical protein
MQAIRLKKCNEKQHLREVLFYSFSYTAAGNS